MEWSDLLRLAMVGYLLYKVSMIDNYSSSILYFQKELDRLEDKIDELKSLITEYEDKKERTVDYIADKLEVIEKEKERE